MEYGYPGTVYNVGSGKAVRVSELLDYLIEMAYCDIQVRQNRQDYGLQIYHLSMRLFKVKRYGMDTGSRHKKTLKEVLDYFREQIKHNGQ